MINIASMAKAGTVNVNLRVDFLEAIESAKIDRSETCFAGKGFLSIEQLAEYMSAVDEMCDETLW